LQCWAGEQFPRLVEVLLSMLQSGISEAQVERIFSRMGTGFGELRAGRLDAHTVRTLMQCNGYCAWAQPFVGPRPDGKKKAAAELGHARRNTNKRRENPYVALEASAPLHAGDNAEVQIVEKENASVPLSFFHRFFVQLAKVPEDIVVVPVAAVPHPKKKDTGKCGVCQRTQSHHKKEAYIADKDRGGWLKCEDGLCQQWYWSACLNVGHDQYLLIQKWPLTKRWFCSKCKKPDAADARNKRPEGLQFVPDDEVETESDGSELSV
jgi:hypothetical protein